MTLVLSVSEFRHQYPDIAPDALRTPWNIPLCDPSGRSYGYRQDVNLRPDLNVLIDDYTLQEDLIVDTSCCHDYEPSLEMELSFMLTGHNQAEGIRAGYNFLLAGWEDIIDEDFHWQSGGRVLKFDIHVEPSFFDTLISQLPEVLPQSLLQNLQSLQPGPKSFFHVHSTTAAMRLAIQQLLDCPYQGPTRWLYWEGKVLELIALRLEQISQSAQLSQLEISSDDVDRIHYAGAILRQRLTMPPSLVELAHLVGLNDYTLKKGFRQVFDTTVFGYLTQERMKQARALLGQQQSVAAVAIAVGYASPTAFSGAFKRRFGISPKRYQMGMTRYERG